MADAPAERGTARPPTGRGREDTVAIPVPPRTATPGRSNGRPRGDSNGQAKVLPPMPPKPTTKPPKAKSRPTTPPATAKTNTPGPKPSAPPPTAKPVVPVAAAAAAVTAPAPAPTRAPAKAPTKPKVKAPRPEKQPKPPKQPRPAKPPKTKAAAKTRPPGRRARLRLTRIDPWSVLKTSFLLSIALGIVTVMSVFMVWSVLDAADVWSSINETVQGVVGGQEAANFDIEDYIGTRRVVGFTMIVAAVDVVLLTAIATLGAFLYNMSASLLGGIEVTLAEDN